MSLFVLCVFILVIFSLSPVADFSNTEARAPSSAIIPIVIGAFGTVTKGLLEGLEHLKVGGRMETIQAILLRMAIILRRVLVTYVDLLSLKLQSKTIS